MQLVPSSFYYKYLSCKYEFVFKFVSSVDIFSYSGPSGIFYFDGKQNTA